MRCVNELDDRRRPSTKDNFTTRITLHHCPHSSWQNTRLSLINESDDVQHAPLINFVSKIAPRHCILPPNRSQGFDDLG